MPETSEVKQCIAVDAMGGDLGPAEIVEAVALAFKCIPKLDRISLVGNEDILHPLVEKCGFKGDSRLTIHHASEVIEMDDKPLQALKKKRDASMVRAIELVKDGHANFLLSCGNTGSLMAGGFIKLRTLDGIDRPALASVIPNKKHHFILVDAGANPEAKPEHLVHNAIMGQIYARIALRIPSPRVGLLTIGTEEGKGNELVSETHRILKSLGSVINYEGPIEGFQVFDDRVDVVVCDGFVGNILLKSCESLFYTLQNFLKEELLRNPIRKFGAFLSQGAFKTMKQQLNPDRYGGAPLLGLRGSILKAHGSSNRHAMMNAIRIGTEVIAADMNHQILEEISAANGIMHATI